MRLSNPLQVVVAATILLACYKNKKKINYKRDSSKKKINKPSKIRGKHSLRF
jgi:hypothetical protein